VKPRVRVRVWFRVRVWVQFMGSHRVRFRVGLVLR
jgi:hypothetical protein